MMPTMRLVLLAAAAASAAAFELPEGYVRVPSGRAVHSDCVYRLPVGDAHLEEVGEDLRVTRGRGGPMVARIRPCKHDVLVDGGGGRGSAAPSPLHGPAWKAWTQFQTQRVINDLTSSWKVPQAPTGFGPGQISYWWNGVEPTENTAVLQPVLAYGANPSGGGYYWSVASWYVSSSHGTVVTPTIRVSPGDTIVGSNRLSSNGSWTIAGLDQQTGETAQFTYKPASSSYTWAYHVLEEYDVTSCEGSYPPSGAVDFFNISLTAGGAAVQPQWDALTKGNSCGEHATVTSPTEVVIHTKPMQTRW